MYGHFSVDSVKKDLNLLKTVEYMNTEFMVVYHCHTVMYGRFSVDIVKKDLNRPNTVEYMS